ncbi:hypothetical protein Poly51_47720 [Rubripirellula tenax]|uniref:Uncharacterized protein n=1 Tax=Rubripirellula tenax TaxID=2528015 RepID=A0A5C6EJ75_9BACT|nr:hypothetical protein [Rubripirellula tenax]TWU48868.1 hypothetical protein Poly51_47720 [Rubripirellula tenax]
MSNRKIHPIMLTADEREAFAEVAKGKRGQRNIAAWKVQPATAMLKRGESECGATWSDQKIAEAVIATTRSIENGRKQAALQGRTS